MKDSKHDIISLEDDRKITQDVKTIEDSDDIKRISGTLPFTTYFIIVCEMCERFAFTGLALVFSSYTQVYLNMDSSQSSAIIRSFTFLCYFTTIICALLADLWLGKFKTVLVCSIWYMIGLVILTISAIHLDFDEPTNNSGWPLIGFCVSLYVFISFGTGGIKTNVATYLGEQVPEGDRTTRHPKIIVDYNLTLERAFQFIYWSVNVGATLGIIVCSVLFNNKIVVWAFAVPAIIFLIAIVSFAMGYKHYVNKPIQGNPMFKAIRCIWAGFKHRKQAPKDGHWLDSAKGKSDEWDDKFIMDLKRTLAGCQVFPLFIIYFALYNNIFDNFISMGLTMERPGWLGPELLNLVSNIIIIVCIPICDKFFYPMMRKWGFELRPITKVIIGFTFCILAFFYVSILQYFIYQTGPYFNFGNVPKDLRFPTNHISIWWQLPVYILLPFSEIFAAISGNEFAFKYAAPELKSIVYSMYLFMNCLGNLIGMILAIWSKHPNFAWLFGVECALMLIITGLLWLFFRNLDEETDEMLKLNKD